MQKIHKMKKQILYIAGPMRGKHRYNQNAFEAATFDLRYAGYQVISPHEIDKVWGWDFDKPLKDQTVTMVDLVRRDVEAISLCDILVVMPGWRQSTGARAEVAIAKWLKKPVRSLASFK